MKSIHEFADKAIDDATESSLWRRFGACAHLGSDLIKGKQEELHALIREAHVVVERQGEIIGLFVTQKRQEYRNGHSEPRFLWIAHTFEGPHAGEVCMADQDMDVEFQHMQR